MSRWTTGAGAGAKAGGKVGIFGQTRRPCRRKPPPPVFSCRPGLAGLVEISLVERHAERLSRKIEVAASQPIDEPGPAKMLVVERGDPATQAEQLVVRHLIDPLDRFNQAPATAEANRRLPVPKAWRHSIAVLDQRNCPDAHRLNQVVTERLSAPRTTEKESGSGQCGKPMFG